MEFSTVILQSSTDNKGLARICIFPSKLAREWKNENFEASKGANVSLSPATKGILGWQETNGNTAVKVYFLIRNFDEWTFNGDIANGKVETK
jgi:hypothetical protein